MDGEFRHSYHDINGIRMHIAEAGEGGEPVVFLHGFPESWYSWRHQMRALAPEFHAIVPDQRGYNETENRPPYDTLTLQQDVLSLLDAFGHQKVHLVAHDWGAIVAWLLAMHHGDRLQTLTICNVPHPAVAEKRLRDPRQLMRSWYIFFFQLPWVPEKLVAAKDYHWLARGLIRDTKPGTFTRQDIKEFLAGWRRQGLAGGINWYRALIRHRQPLPDPVPVIETPTLFIWGENDRALRKELTHGTGEYVRNLQMEYLPGVSHWVQQEAPDEVNRLLLAHLRAHPMAT